MDRSISIQSDFSYERPRSALPARLIWSLVGNVCYALTQFGIVFLISRLGLNAVGQFSFYFALTTPFFIFSQLQLRSLRLADGCGEIPFGGYLALRIVASLSALVCSMCVGLLFLPFEEFAGVTLVAIAKCCDSISDIYYAEMYRLGLVRRAGLVKSVKGGVTIACLAAVLTITATLNLVLLALAAVWLGMLVLIESRSVSCRKPVSFRSPESRGFRLDSKFLVLVRRGLPLGFAAVLVTVQSIVPRLAIDLFHSAESLGVFALANQLVMVITVLTAAVAQVVTPTLARLKASGNQLKFRRAVNVLVVCGLLSSGIAILLTVAFGAKAIWFVYGVAIDHEQLMLNTLVFGACVAAFSSMFAVLLHVEKASARILMGTAWGAGISLSASFALVPLLNGAGAALALVMANLATLAVHGLSLWAVLGEKKEEQAAVATDLGCSNASVGKAVA